MSPREMMSNVANAVNPATVLDLKDRDTGDFAYGKTVPLCVIICIIVFHAFKNPFDLGTAILISTSAIGPWALIKFLQRTSVTIQAARTQSRGGTVVSEQQTTTTGALPHVAPAVVPDEELGD